MPHDENVRLLKRRLSGKIPFHGFGCIRRHQKMSALSGNTANNEDMQRFSGISTLLFSKPEVSQFLLSEMRLQQALADIFKILTEAADVEMAVPGAEG